MDLNDRVQQELDLLKSRYPSLEFRPEGQWVRIPSYPLPPGWNRTATDVAFQIVAPPGAPYGIYVPGGLLFNGQRPNNYSDTAPAVPFGGGWAVFSWSPGDGEWKPGATPQSGSNYLNWALGFADRFGEGV